MRQKKCFNLEQNFSFFSFLSASCKDVPKVRTKHKNGKFMQKWCKNSIASTQGFEPLNFYLVFDQKKLHNTVVAKVFATAKKTGGHGRWKRLNGFRVRSDSRPREMKNRAKWLFFTLCIYFWPFYLNGIQLGYWKRLAWKPYVSCHSLLSLMGPVIDRAPGCWTDSSSPRWYMHTPITNCTKCTGICRSQLNLLVQWHHT